MPPNHQKYTQWNGDRFRKWAAKMGRSTVAVIESILTGYKVEQQGYRACMALLKLSDQYTPERLEAACAKALFYTPHPSYKSIQTILKSGQDNVNEHERQFMCSSTRLRSKPVEEPSAPPEQLEFGFTRGADYYGRWRK